MSTVIETGKTVEEALEKALIALGRSKDEVDYEVLEQPSRGFFGLFGGHMARLRVTEKQAAPDASAFAAPAAAAAQPARPGQDVPDAAPAAGTPRARAYDLSGESLGILIGKHGQTLDALQYLTNLAANRGCEEGRIHVILDVEGYRSRREETLRRLAGHLAEKACRIHAEVRLEPMNRHERKIIHMALQDNYRVSTYSDGDEPYRCVVIAPKRRRRYQRDWSRERGED